MELFETDISGQFLADVLVEFGKILEGNCEGNFVGNFMGNFFGNFWGNFLMMFRADFTDNILDTFQSYFISASFGSEYLQSCLSKKFCKV